MPLTPRYEQQYYEVVLQHLNVPYYLRYLRDDNPPYFNTELDRLFREPASQAIQTALDDLSPKEQLLNHLSMVKDDTAIVDLPIKLLDDTYLLVNESPLFSVDQALIGYIGQIQRIEDSSGQTNDYILRLSFEKALAQISTLLVGNSSAFNQTITTCLEVLAKASGASRSYVFLFRDAYQFMDNTHEWCANGVSSEINNLQDLPTSDFKWWMSKMYAQEVIYIKSLSELPESESHLKDVLADQNIHSLIAFPLIAESQLIGYVGLDNVETYDIWHSEDFALLKFTSVMFSSAFERKRYIDTLSLNNQNLSHALNELRTLQSQMIQQEKMVGIGQLAAGIAHEINNPLGYIASNLETLIKYISRLSQYINSQNQKTRELSLIASEPEIRAYKEELEQLLSRNKIEYVLHDINDLLEDSKSGFERVSHIIMSLRNFARMDQNARHEIYNLNQIIDEVLQILGSEIKYAAVVHKEVDPFIEIRCNRTEIGQVILNLVLNGVQAIKSSSKLTLGIVEIIATQSDKAIKLSIKDDGIGIPDDIQAHIFDPFFTTKDVGSGTGLGLSIAYDIIVNKHNGNITLESEMGKGTTFFIEFKND